MYTELAEIPVPTGAQFISNHDTKDPTVVQVSYSVRDHTMKTKRSMSKPLIFFAPAVEDAPKGVPMGTSLEDTSQIILQVVSPSKKKRASLRKSENSGGSKFVEIWNEGLLESSLDVSDLHGDFYGDEYFGSLEFAPNELALIYVAENLPNDKTDDDPYRTYRFKPDFGEGLVGKRDPAIFLLSWSASSPPILYQVNSVGLGGNVFFGQPIFDPQTPNVIYATGYELTQGGRVLGIKGCFNRPSGIWRLTIPSSPFSVPRDGVKDTVKHSLIATESVQKLTPPHFSCRSPRAVKTDSGTTLVWLACICGGAHVSTSTLHALDITFTPGMINDQALLASDKPLVDVRSEPLKDLNTFPGLYPSYNLPASPFILDDLSQTNILLHSQWGSRTTILQISLKDGSIREVLPDGNGSLFSWSVLATDGRGQVVCSRSTPDVPYQIWLGQVRKHRGDLQWSLLDEPTLPNHVSSALASVKTRIVPLGNNSLVETVVVHLQRTSKNSGLPPCVTIPHGGPHASSTTAFTPNITALVLEGYTISLPNYTGTPGYGEAFLQGLIGRCGELDVSDCIATARHLIGLGISEDGPGKQFIVGGSHGGFLTAHLIAKFPSFFSAAVLRNPVISTGEISTSDIPDWYFSEFGLQYPLFSSNRSMASTLSDVSRSIPPVMEPRYFSKLRSMSPISHLDQVQVPVLLMIGSADRRVAPSHGIEFYHALRAKRATENREKSVEMLLFEGEGHPLDGVKAARIMFEATRDWFKNVDRDK